MADTYSRFFGGKAKLIVDVGSRDGNDARWLMRSVGNRSTRVVCIEARESAANKIKKSYPKFEVINTAVSDFNGSSSFVEFSSAEFAGSSSLRLSRANAYPVESKIVTVPVTTLDDILDDSCIDILKVDVEGASVDVINGLGKKAKNVLVAHIETETQNRVYWGEKPNNQEMIAIMERLGFGLASVSYQWGWSIQDQIWVNIEHERYLDR